MNIIKQILMKWFDLEREPCQSCETLKIQLEIANYEKKQLLETILSYTKPVVEERAPVHEIEPIKPKTIPWTVRRQMLEAEDRKKAQLIREQEEIRKLEEEMNIGSEVSDANR